MYKGNRNILTDKRKLNRILWFNWRDIKNPDAGGAEVYTYEIGRRLILKGYDITLFVPRFPNCLQNEWLMA